MRFLDNIYDPSKPYSDMYVIIGLYETQEEAIRHLHEWLNGKITGRPQASEKHTVEQLEAMGMVGVYLQENEA